MGSAPKTFKALITVAFPALHSFRFSLRKMEQDMGNHLAYRWQKGDKVVDRSTMGCFLAGFHVQIAELSLQVVKICQERGLIEFDLLAIDSLKLRAIANYKRLQKEEDKLKGRLEELLRCFLELSIGISSSQPCVGLRIVQGHLSRIVFCFCVRTYLH